MSQSDPDIVAQLREEYTTLAGVGIERGSLDASLSAIVAQTAADEIERLRGLMVRWVAVYENCDITTGYCCCGEDMDRHTDPMHAGHAPVDMGAYQSGKLCSETKEALGTKADG
jgi:hypothetical protein